MLNVLESANKPLAIEQFTLLEQPESATLFYGIILRSEFDNDRIKINKNFKPKKFYTVIKTENEFGIFYFYGSFIKTSTEYKDLFTNLDSFAHLNKHQNINNYKKILSLFNLSCKETFRFFSQGIYPIDSEHREKLFSSKIDFNNFFKGNKNYPFFLTIVSPIILYFTNNNKNIFEFKNYLTTNTKL
jgi:hypothetical protein